MPLEKLDIRFTKPLLAGILLAFGALTVVAIAQHGYLGIFAIGIQDTAGAQVLWDLVISAGLLAGWMIQDARKNDLTVWPYLVGVLFLGSISPLIYLLRRPAQLPTDA